MLHRTRRWFAASFHCLALLLTPLATLAAPQDSVVFIHGFLGWGREEMLGVKYWGGPGQDFQEDLKARGINAVTVGVGPVSSNWDRAVEAYHQLKGGCVDYGEAHAAKHGHARHGRCYQALLPDWSEEHPANIVAHSQGGQTARVLAHLLAYGAPAETDRSGAGTSALFRGGKTNWVRSVTTLSSPHNGTTLTKGVYTVTFNLAEQLVGVIAALAGNSNAASSIYDFKLDQWGLHRNDGERFADYLARIKASPVMQPGHTHDLSSWDLSPEGAAELNAWVKTVPEIYYHSLSTASTYRGLFSDNAYPTATSALILGPGALWMGSYRNLSPRPGEVRIDDKWLQNDAVVNTVSMTGPTGSSVVAFNAAAPRKGVWNHMGLWDGWDHMDIIGHSWDLNIIDYRNPRDFYLNLGNYLKNLH